MELTLKQKTAFGIGAVGKLDHSQMLTDPEEAAAFVQATGYSVEGRWAPPTSPVLGGRPAVNVTYADAEAYARADSVVSGSGLVHLHRFLTGVERGAARKK